MPLPQNLMLWTNPRCCGTAFELMMEARGDYRIEVNVFDPVFYFFDGEGTDPPKVPVEREQAEFRKVYDRFKQRSLESPTFLRCSAYTVMHHFTEADWRSMVHTFLIRDPRYVLPSHRRFVKNLTREEAGYTAQRDLFRYLKRISAKPPRVLDAHELLADPEGVLTAWCQAVGIPPAPHSLRWVPGYRERWGMWTRWKRAAAGSTHFFPFHPNRERERNGAEDPLFLESWSCYRELFEARLRVAAANERQLTHLAG